MELIERTPVLCKQGVTVFDPGHVHQLNSRSLNHLCCFFCCTTLVHFRDNRYNGQFSSRENESVPKRCTVSVSSSPSCRLRAALGLILSSCRKIFCNAS